MKEISILLFISFLYLILDILIAKNFYKSLKLNQKLFWLALLFLLPFSAFFLVLLVGAASQSLRLPLDFGHAGEGPLVAFLINFLNALAFFLVIIFDFIRKSSKP